MNRKSTHRLLPPTLLTRPLVQSASLSAVFALFLLIGSLPSAGQGGLLVPTIQSPSVVQLSNTNTMHMWVPTQAGVNYTAEFRSLPNAGFWSQLTNFAGSGSSDPLSDNVTAIPQRFYRVAVDPRPWIRSQPRSRTPYAGDTVQFDVAATGRLPLAYQWNGPSGLLSDGTRISGSTTAHLVIANVDPSDVGNYWASVTNLYGSTSCVPAGLRITLSQAPRILIDPQTQSLLVGQNLSLWSTASGAPTIGYKWYGPAGLLVDNTRVAGSSTTNLLITGLQVIDDGGYYMVVSNPYGMATSSVATVRVQLGLPPRITSDPLSQTIIAGQTLNLTVTAEGTQTLNYQWYGPSGLLSNGGKISGATTANLTVSNFQVTDNGNYYVVVTNTFGTATSVTASVLAQ